MKKIMVSGKILKDIANNIAKVYPFSGEKIYNVILQTRSLDTAIDIVEACTDNAFPLDYGVYCWLKNKDDKKFNT